MGLAHVLRGDAADADALSSVEAQLAAALAAPPRGARERALQSDARSRLALLLAQEGRDDEAAALMSALGARYRLARQVLRYPLPPPGPAEAPAEAPPVVRALDSALPASMVAHLRAAFAPDSAFWAAHSYHDAATGYFSFTHALGAPRNAFEQALAAVAALAAAWRPEAGAATAVEWWAHCRPHASGHQLHFDSADEGAGADGPRHPLVSAVLYLSDGEAAQVGGPTLVTEQRRVATPGAGPPRLAERAWLVHPSPGRLAMFDGSVLHGVLPGRGPSPAPGCRRVTLMVALWRHMEPRHAPPDAPPGAQRAFPDQQPWAATLAGGAPRDEWGAAAAAAVAAAATPAPVRALGRMWEDVDAVANAAAGASLEQLASVPHYALCFQGF